VLRTLAVKELAEGNAGAVSAMLCELIATGHTSPQWTGLASVLYSLEVVAALFEWLAEGEDVAKAAAHVLTALASNQLFRVAISRPRKIAEDVTVTEEEDQSELMLAEGVRPSAGMPRQGPGSRNLRRLRRRKSGYSR